MPGPHRTQIALVVLSMAGALAGCNSVHSTYVPDGRRGFVVSCGGVLNGWSSCLVQAGRACGNHGYDVIKGSEEDRSMLIACKVPPIPPAPVSTGQ
jgi:hypothetical protein